MGDLWMAVWRDLEAWKLGRLDACGGKGVPGKSRHSKLRNASRPQRPQRQPSPESAATDPYPEDEDEGHLPYVCVIILLKLPQTRLMCARVPQCFRTPRASQVSPCTTRNRRVQAGHRIRENEEAATSTRSGRRRHASRWVQAVQAWRAGIRGI